MSLKRVYEVAPLPYRSPEGHKGTFKRVLVVGGSAEMLGASVFSATAALRAGAGLVQVATHPSLLAHALTLCPELVGHALDPRSDRRLLAAAEQADVLVVGPGMGLDAAGQRRLLGLIKFAARAATPMVLDADGLTLLANERKPPRLPAGSVMTPHPGEMSRLGKHFGDAEIGKGDRARMEQAAKAAERFGCTVVLKGARTVVCDGGSVYVEPTATSALAKAGTGDVLAGLLGTLLGQMTATNGTAFAAAALAVHLHARTGMIAGRALGERSVLARDVIEALSGALRDHPEAVRPADGG